MTHELGVVMKGFVRSLVSAAVIGATVSTQAFALCVLPGIFSTSVVSTTSSTWIYNFTVNNGCGSGGFLTDVFLPYFSDAGITDITVPTDNTSMYPGSTVSWSATIEPSNDVFGLAGAGAIDFHVTVSPELLIAPGEPLPGVDGTYFSSGFSFTASYDGVKGPSGAEVAEFGGGDRFFSVDPLIPGSPLTLAALDATPTTTPEPATLTLLATGFVGLAAVVKKRRSV